MTIVVCLDDKNGMMFNKRRQSKDRKLIRNLTELLQGQKLWMHSYSRGLFADAAEGIEVRDDFLTAAPDDAVCFVENQDIRPLCRQA